MGRRQKIVMRLAAFLSLIRWTHIAFIAYAQLVIGLGVTGNHDVWHQGLLQRDFIGLLVSTAFIVAAGSLVNSFYDLERDLTVRPWRTLFERPVARKYGVYIATWSLASGMAAALFLLPKPLTIAMFAYAGLIWLYSHKQWSQQPWGALSATVLAFYPLLLLVLLYWPSAWGPFKTSLPYGIVLFMIEWRRQHERIHVSMPPSKAYHRRQWAYKAILTIGVLILPFIV